MIFVGIIILAIILFALFIEILNLRLNCWICVYGKKFDKRLLFFKDIK